MTRKRIIITLIISLVVIFAVVGAIVLTNVLSSGGNRAATPDEATTVQPTTVQPTTVQPTTVAPTTVAPTTVQPTNAAPAAEDTDDFVGGVGGYDIGGAGSNIDAGDKSDMDGSKDSSSKDTDNQGRPIVYGGDEGYGANTNGDPAPIPEEQFEERHPLPGPVNPEKDFPDSEVITYDDIQNGKQPEEGDIIQLTPAN